MDVSLKFEDGNMMCDVFNTCNKASRLSLNRVAAALHCRATCIISNADVLMCATVGCGHIKTADRPSMQTWRQKAQMRLSWLAVISSSGVRDNTSSARCSAASSRPQLICDGHNNFDQMVIWKFEQQQKSMKDRKSAMMRLIVHDSCVNVV